MSERAADRQAADRQAAGEQAATDGGRASPRDPLAYPRSMVSPIYSVLGFDITDGGEGWLELTLRLSDVVMNADGAVHGGVWTLVADSAMGGAVRTLIEPEERAITAQSDFRWLRPLAGDAMRVVGRVLRRGRTLWHTTVECFDTDGQVVGTGTGTFVVARREGGPPGAQAGPAGPEDGGAM